MVSIKNRWGDKFVCESTFVVCSILHGMDVSFVEMFYFAVVLFCCLLLVLVLLSLFFVPLYLHSTCLL